MNLCCAHCDAQFDVSGREAGTFVKCRCGDVLVIPQPESVEAATMVRAYIQRLVADEGIALGSDVPVDRWVFQRGSARIEIAFNSKDNDLTVESAILPLPDDPVRRQALYQRVLELNHRSTGEARFAVRGHDLIVTFTRDVTGMDYVEFRSAVASVSRTADDYDDELRRLYCEGTTADEGDEEVDLSALEPN